MGPKGNTCRLVPTRPACYDDLGETTAVVLGKVRKRQGASQLSSRARSSPHGRFGRRRVQMSWRTSSLGDRLNSALAEDEKPVHRRTLCKFDEQCTRAGCHFVHSWDRCRWGDACYSRACRFVHTRDMCKWGAGCDRGRCRFIHPLPATTAIDDDRSRLTCAFFPACRAGRQCPYMHPQVPCKYGVSCDRDDCTYLHGFERGLSAPTILTRLLALLLADAERRSDGEAYTTLSQWHRLASRWPLDESGSRRTFSRKQLLACVALESKPPPQPSQISLFRLPRAARGASIFVGFPPAEALPVARKRANKRAKRTGRDDDAYAALRRQCAEDQCWQALRHWAAPPAAEESEQGEEEEEQQQQQEEEKEEEEEEEEEEENNDDDDVDDDDDEAEEEVSTEFRGAVDDLLRGARFSAIYGIGYSLLLRMGWEHGQGLGLDGSGEPEPVSALCVGQKSRLGLGAPSARRRRRAPQRPGPPHRQSPQV